MAASRCRQAREDLERVLKSKHNGQIQRKIRRTYPLHSEWLVVHRSLVGFPFDDRGRSSPSASNTTHPALRSWAVAQGGTPSDPQKERECSWYLVPGNMRGRGQPLMGVPGACRGGAVGTRESGRVASLCLLWQLRGSYEDVVRGRPDRGSGSPCAARKHGGLSRSCVGMLGRGRRGSLQKSPKAHSCSVRQSDCPWPWHPPTGSIQLN
jgi:hypothetical protein